MKINKFKKLVATVGAAALISTGLVVAVAAPAQAADPVCVTDAKSGTTTCNGVLTTGAAYKTMVPESFDGTFFFW